VAARGQYTLQTDGLILALLATLGRELGLAPQSSNQTCLDGGPLKRVIEHVEENLARNVPLAELAATAGLSPTHFARQFRRVTGTSPHQYLLKRRLRRAGLLLSTTTHPLTDIAAEAGFASQAHMTSIFSRNLGVTPARYRAICAT
jgi:AraC family transcriptional regulator